MQANILVVEDDESLADWICDYLSDHGYQVTHADRGDTALDLIRSDEPDLVLLDIMLPVKDGFEVCRQARAFYANPILMMTACSEEADEVLALDEALDRLAAMNERACQVIQYRFYSGLTLDETAEVLGVSVKTVQRDWLSARAWLRKEVKADLDL